MRKPQNGVIHWSKRQAMTGGLTVLPVTEDYPSPWERPGFEKAPEAVVRPMLGPVEVVEIEMEWLDELGYTHRRFHVIVRRLN